MDLWWGWLNRSRYSGTTRITSLSSVGSGSTSYFANGGGAYYSPDGLNLGGGGTSVRIYAGPSEILQIVPVEREMPLSLCFKAVPLL